MTHHDPDDEMIAAAFAGADPQPTDRDDADADPERDDRQRALVETVAALDLLLESAPPPDIRANVLTAAAGRRPPQPEPSPVADLFANQVAALAELLDELDGDDWNRPVEAYDWTVHGLIAHLLVIEHYTAGRLGIGPDDPSADSHLVIGADRISDELRRDPNATATEWLERAEATSDALYDDSRELPTEVDLHCWPFSLDGATIARAFEIWTHADDIRRATGRPVWSPIAGDLRLMSGFSVRALPLTLALTAPDQMLTPTRVVLTGPGGGTYDIGDDPGADTTIVTDVVDYCRLVARRIAPEDLDCTIDGDPTLAHALLTGASALAGGTRLLDEGFASRPARRTRRSTHAVERSSS
jgi:uncharacterized protein (TIGR03083 family)